MPGPDDLTRFDHLVPSAGDDGTRLGRIEGLLARVLTALGADRLQPGAPAGIIQRQDAQEGQLADHELRLTTLEDEREDHGDWLRGALWDVAKLAGAAGLGAWIGKGGH